MKLFRFDGGRLGIARGDDWFDVTEAFGADVNSWPPVQSVQIIAKWDPKLVDHPKARRIDPAAIKLETPIVWPNKLLAFPVNYVKHGEEMKSKNRADLNGFFLKANSSLSGPNDAIELPDMPDREIHHECEVGIVIGKAGRHVKRENAFEHIFGYACLIDMVVRGNEERVMRKSFDTFCPFGPWVTTADEVPNPNSMWLKLWVNGEIRQNANTKDLIVDIPGMIESASRVATLLPGDIIATGTPEGVGPVKRGDRVRIEVEHCGSMDLEVR